MDKKGYRAITNEAEQPKKENSALKQAFK